VSAAGGDVRAQCRRVWVACVLVSFIRKLQNAFSTANRVCEIQTRMQGKTAETKKCVCEIEADSRDASERKGEPKEQERKRMKKKKEGLQHLVFPCGHPSQY
jgi:hypothetical protein